AKPATKQDLENAVRYMDGRIDVMGALKIMEQKEVEINSLERKVVRKVLFVLLERKGNELNMAVFLLCVSVAFFIASIVIRLTS
ncbi:MAG: hypothetical protein M0R06_06190, partial [Sphaerochaeta sp.]|nr:hypothetical protein [Sphaerochaeta sp.]